MTLPPIIREHPYLTGLGVVAVGALILYLLMRGGSSQAAPSSGAAGAIGAYYAAAAGDAASNNQLAAIQSTNAAQTAQVGLVTAAQTQQSYIGTQGAVDIYALGDKTQIAMANTAAASGLYSQLIAANSQRASETLSTLGYAVNNSLEPAGFSVGNLGGGISIPTVSTLPKAGNA